MLTTFRVRDSNVTKLQEMCSLFGCTKTKLINNAIAAYNPAHISDSDKEKAEVQQESFKEDSKKTEEVPKQKQRPAVMEIKEVL